MLFNSYSFIFLFLPVVAVVFYILASKNKTLAAFWMGMSSLFFYGWWNPQFVTLLVGSILVNFYFALKIVKLSASSIRLIQPKTILIFAITFNILLLGYFKYTNFFINSINHLGHYDWLLLDITLPLGISFFTFTQISFLVDVYRNEAREYSFVHYLLFVTYFPHLIAGPVLHHKQMMPQFAKNETYQFNVENFNEGLVIFTLGLFKKVVVADKFAVYADAAFNQASFGVGLDFYGAWTGALAYTLQLYFDFSAYSDMAIGLSLLFNVKLPINFNSPYKASNMIDFWRRWHITLSTFLRDYVYIVLGGNRKGEFRRYLNLLLTMLIGGFWHGANWTFVLWGGLHGVYLMINHLWVSFAKKFELKIHRIPATITTFVAVVFAWVLFRAENIGVASSIMSSMISIENINQNIPRTLEVQMQWVFCGLLAVWFLPNTLEIVKKIEFKPKFDKAFGFVIGALLVVVMLNFKKTSPFIYFQF